MMTTINGEHLCVSLVPLFNQLSLPDQKRIETMVHHHHYQRREIILSPGDEGKLLIVEAGRLKLYQLSESGDEQVLAVLGTDEYVGEQWLYGAANEATFSVVEQDAAICELTYDAFTNLLAEYPGLAARLLQLTMAKVRELTAQNQFLVIDGVEERLWAYLSHLASQRGGRFTLPMKMKDLAAYLGTTPETLSRKFRHLQEEGKITRQNRVVTISRRIYN